VPAPAIAVIDDGADVVVFEVVVAAAASDAPRVAVRAPVKGVVDVVNVEALAGVDGTSAPRRVRFLVEADRANTAYDVTVIVDVGGNEVSYVGPSIAPKPHHHG
jgi:hypothetical protein